MTTIIIEPYNAEWPNEFVKIREYLWPHIKDCALDIIHIGSTSVPGLAAKPIIDFNIIIDSYDVFPWIVEQLKSLGYEHDGDGGIPTRERFKGGLRDNLMDYNMYVCPKDSPVLDAQILFRDYLRQNNSTRDEYAALKQSLAEKHRHDINAYVDGKHEFIMHIAITALNQRNSSCYCGHDCSRCITYLATINNDDDLRRKSQSFYRKKFGWELPLTDINCFGGRSNKEFILCKGCPWMKCCREKEIDSCSECVQYPCKPLAEYIEKYVNKYNQIGARSE